MASNPTCLTCVFPNDPMMTTPAPDLEPPKPLPMEGGGEGWAIVTQYRDRVHHFPMRADDSVSALWGRHKAALTFDAIAQGGFQEMRLLAPDGRAVRILKVHINEAGSVPDGER